MKDKLRKKMRRARQNLNKDFVNACATAISQLFFSTDFPKYKRIMAYIAIDNEADPSLIIEECIKNGVEVFVPSLDSNDNIHPVRYLDSKSLAPGRYNVPEPDEKDFDIIKDFDLILVPGVAFSYEGNRIGFGKGCYDSFLKNKKAVKIGVCYEFQFIENGPVPDIHDVKMDFILTEKKMYEV